MIKHEGEITCPDGDYCHALTLGVSVYSISNTGNKYGIIIKIIQEIAMKHP